MQCDAHCSEYSPCISTCPTETCDNILNQAKDQFMCHSDTCVEGCQLKPCPPEQIYKNNTFSDCVPKSVCKHVCLVIDGITYYEGDIMESDNCKTCQCSRGKKLCSGVGCDTTELPNVIPEFPQLPEYKDSEDICRSGWSAWINQDQMYSTYVKTAKTKTKNLKIGDTEPIPTQFILCNLVNSSSCAPDFMKKIECRTVGTQMLPKATGENVQCSLEKGLICEGPCHDYEIRIFCDCADEVEIITLPTTIPHIHFIDSSTPMKLIQKSSTPSTLNLVKVNKKCDPTIPHVEYPGDCYKFLHCQPAADGSWTYAEKTCGPTMMFNPNLMICDWIASVKALKPECGQVELITPAPILNKCPVGKVWSECAVPCGQSCHYYGKLLKQLGTCNYGSNDCEPGCVDESRSLQCPNNKRWRDNKACVSVSDCTCMTDTGILVKVSLIKITEN